MMDNGYNYTGFDQPKKKRGGAKLALTLALCIAVSGLTSAGVYTYLDSRDSKENTTQADATGSEYSALQLASNSEDDSATTDAANSTGSSDISAIAAKAMDSVVEITTEVKQTNPLAMQYVTEGAGSGVILTADGYIVTNNHVIEGASNITVRLPDGTEYTAELIGTDDQTDLAVLKIEATGLKAATFADSDKIVVGDTAVAIGNPLGELGGTVTNGIISALNREITIENQTMTLLQTSAAVNPGNSGGGLFDSEGNLIGVVNAKSSGTDIEGLAFAIPSNTVAEVVAEIMENGYVSGRPQLGITVADIDSQTAMMYGMSTGTYIMSSNEGNGLQQGDKIISINGKEVTAVADISSILDESEVGDVVTVQVVRDGSTMNVDVTLTERTPDTEASTEQETEDDFQQQMPGMQQRPQQGEQDSDGLI